MIFGDSHVRSLNRVNLDFELGQETSLALYRLKSKNHPQQAEDSIDIDQAISLASELGEDDCLWLSILGTYHNIFGLLNHPNSFSVVSKKQGTELASSSDTLIPYDCMGEHFKNKWSMNKKFTKLVTSTKAKVFHLSAPPPKGDQQFLDEKISSYRGALKSEVGINSPTNRLALWELEMDFLQEYLLGLDVHLMAPPLGTITSEGFLKKDYYENDATHANAEYGKLVMKQIIEKSGVDNE